MTAWQEVGSLCAPNWLMRWCAKLTASVGLVALRAGIVSRVRNSHRVDATLHTWSRCSKCPLRGSEFGPLEDRNVSKPAAI